MELLERCDDGNNSSSVVGDRWSGSRERETNGAVTVNIGYSDSNISECKENKL